jgi:hypothetical protein
MTKTPSSLIGMKSKTAELTEEYRMVASKGYGEGRRQSYWSKGMWLRQEEKMGKF